MIDDAIRAALLDQFPAGMPLVVVARDTAFYAGRARDNPHVRVVTLGEDGVEVAAVAGAPLIVDGLDLLDDPAAALRALRAAAPGARAFALIANAAHARALADFIDGSLRGSWHPLVKADLGPLFAASGWHVHEIASLPDVALLPPSLPVVLALGAVGVHVTTAEERDRIATAAYVVIADAA